MEYIRYIHDSLFKYQDLSYKEFQSKLIPTVSKETIIGVRMPALRSLAKELVYGECSKVFLKSLPHRFYEENNLHAFIIESIPSYEECITELNRFLPYVDNWATCDSIRPKCFCKNAEKLLSEIKVWLNSANTYTVRFGLEMLMIWFLDEHFRPEYLELASAVNSEEYYIRMMQAWYFATALAKQYDSAILYLKEKKLSEWVHNKTIQKALESNRIENHHKEILRQLKRQ